MVTRPVIVTGANITRAVKTLARVRGAGGPVPATPSAARLLGPLPKLSLRVRGLGSGHKEWMPRLRLPCALLLLQ